VIPVGPIRDLAHRALSGALDLLFPPRCRVCETHGCDPICPLCYARLERVSGPLCHLCGLPFDASTHHGNLCPECRAARRIDRIRSVCHYTGRIRKAIGELKYRGHRELVAPLAQVLQEYLSNALDVADTVDPYYTAPPSIGSSQVDLLIPVPLFATRERERGFNQAGLLAEELGRLEGLVVASGALVRKRETPPQVGLSAIERRVNVRGAFEAVDRAAIRARTILLLDDVCTTGATLEECAKTLVRAGAERVWAITLARQHKDWASETLSATERP